MPDLSQPAGWLPVAFSFVMGLSILIYVVLDGYDLGVGILAARADEGQRNMMVASIGPFWDANETWLVLGVGAAFEFPLLIVMAIHFGMLRVQTLRKYRRHSIVVIFLIAAVVTPTPDPFTQCLFAAPLYVLFEIAILVGSRVQAKREARLASEA